MLPDKVGAFYTFGRKKVGASLKDLVKPKQRAELRKGKDSQPAAAKTADVTNAVAAVSAGSVLSGKVVAGAAGATAKAAPSSVATAASRVVKSGTAASRQGLSLIHI